MGMVMNKLDGSFQSTPSAWRETAYIDLSNGVLTISIHSLRMEGDMSSATYFPAWYIFQSTPSAWRETYDIDGNGDWITFQSTPSAWRETGHTVGYACNYQAISIHSLRMEGDSVYNKIPLTITHFNPLPPHGGRLDIAHYPCNECCISIHSLRMEGDNEFFTNFIIPIISIHSLRMEGDLFSIVLSKSPNCISIHSLRMEGDVAVQIGHAAVSLSFQSTPSAWRETFPPFKSGDAFLISIHSLRMEGDH